MPHAEIYSLGFLKPRRDLAFCFNFTQNFITELLIPTHEHFHWLKFIKNI